MIPEKITVRLSENTQDMISEMIEKSDDVSSVNNVISNALRLYHWYILDVERQKKKIFVGDNNYSAMQIEFTF